MAESFLNLQWSKGAILKKRVGSDDSNYRKIAKTTRGYYPIFLLSKFYMGTIQERVLLAILRYFT